MGCKVIISTTPSNKKCVISGGATIPKVTINVFQGVGGGGGSDGNGIYTAVNNGANILVETAQMTLAQWKLIAAPLAGQEDSRFNLFSSGDNLFRLQFSTTATTDANGIFLFPDQQGTLFTTESKQADSAFQWLTPDYQFAIQTTGQLVNTAYMSGSLTGTVFKNIAVDAGGNFIQPPIISTDSNNMASLGTDGGVRVLESALPPEALITDHTFLTSIGTNSHATIDTHIADATIHFSDATSDGSTYGRNNGAWAVVVSNATHTGEVTGATALVVDKTAITGQTLVTALGTDHVLIADASDTGNLKRALISDFINGGMFDSNNDTNTWGVANFNFLGGTTTGTQTGSAEFRFGATATKYISMRGSATNPSIFFADGGATSSLVHVNATGLFIDGESAVYLRNSGDSSGIFSDVLITLTRAVVMSQYGSGTQTDTATFMAAFSSSGALIEEPLPVSNVTHTGEVTGATALVVDKTAITGKSLVTAVGTDHVLIADASDTGNLKKALISDFSGVSDHTLLTNIGTNSHATIDTHIADATIHFADATSDGSIYGRKDGAWEVVPTGVTHTGEVTGATALVVDKTAITGQTLVTAVGTDHVLIADASDTGNLKRALISDFSGVSDHTLLTNIGTNTHAQIDTHIADGTLHFTEGSIAHANISGIGTNSHATIDTHIADATIHFADATSDGSIYGRKDGAWEVVVSNATHTGEVTGATALVVDKTAITGKSLVTAVGTDHVLIADASDTGNLKRALISDFSGVSDHTLLTNIGTNSHATIDTHIADATIHFTEGSIAHANISGVGTNTHAQIDTHISDGTLHFTEGSIAHANISGVGTNTHAQIDTHIADATIHFSAPPPMLKSITVEDPTSSENITMFYTDVAITISQVNDVVQGSTPSITYNIEYAATRTGSSTVLWTSDRVLTSTTGVETTTFNNAAIPADRWIWLTTSAQSGTTDEMSVTLKFALT